MKRFFAYLALTVLISACGGVGGGTRDGTEDAVGRQDGGDGHFVGDQADEASDGGDGQELPAWPAGRYISCEQVYGYLQAGLAEMLPLNVSDEEFYNLGSIAGSLKIPWDELGGRLSEVDPGRYLVVYCRRGVRSESAYDTLDGAGYPHKWIMEGGMERWNSLGYPTVP